MLARCVDTLRLVTCAQHFFLPVVSGLTDPSNHTASGVAHFDLTNPLIAFLASADAVAPHIVFSVSTINYTHIDVSYILRDIDNSEADAVCQLYVLSLSSLPLSLSVSFLFPAIL